MPDADSIEAEGLARLESIPGVAQPVPALPGIDANIGLQFLASSPDCVKILTPDGNLVFMNDHGRRLMEIGDDALVISKAWSAFWPADKAAVIDNAVTQAAAGHVIRFASQCPTATGRLKWWDVIIRPIADEQGTLLYLLAISRDITRQKEIEESFRIGEQRFRALADNIAQFAWMADATGYIFWYNQRWFDYTGTDLSEMSGWGWRKVHHPEHVDRVVKKFTHCIETGTVWEDTFPLRGIDGTYRWFLSRAMPIRDEEGNVVLWCGTNTDITDQRRTGQRLSQLARLVELSHEAIMVWDPDDGVLLWNKGCSELFGFTSDEALGQDPFTLLRTGPSLSRDELIDNLENEGQWSGEIKRLASDGTEVWIDGRLELIRVGNKRVILETNRDVTERRRADDMRNLLVAELNHRVKNTLAIVQSLSSQTARTSTSMRDFVDRFNGRIQSLSSAHNILTDKNWSNAGVRDLINSQVLVTAGTPERLEISGPDACLPPQTALQCALILHELTTNAVKHGALATPDGRVSINWSIERGQEPTLNLVWQESGVSIEQPPSASGFGLTLIERSGKLPTLDTDLDFAPGGIVCRITAKIDAESGTEAPYFNPRASIRQASTF